MKNRFISQFHEDLRLRYPVDGASMTYCDWLCANTYLGSRKFSVEGYEFQRDIINDLTPNMSVIKPSQVGMTEVQVRKFLTFLARNRGTSGILTFPSESMYKNNSKTRIKPVVTQAAFKSHSIEDDRPTRTVGLFEINGSFAHITGMTEGDATSTPADILFHDELDLSDQAMIGLFQSRLQNSDFKIDQAFSTPTHPGYGIDARYTISDQREYMHRCGACNHWATPVWSPAFVHIEGYHGDGSFTDIDADMLSKFDLTNTYVKCEACSKPLDMRDPTLREWVAKFPARNFHGYRVRPFSTYRLPPSYIVAQFVKMKNLDNVKGFYNTVLGETYADGTSRLDSEVIRRVMKSPSIPEMGRNPVALGCDMGKTCHLTLGHITQNGLNPFLFEQVPVGEIELRIKQLRDKYNIVTGGTDRHPYTPTSDAIARDSRMTILPIEYRGTAAIALKNDEYGSLDHCQINRTAAIDATVKAIQSNATEISGYGGLGSVLIEQLCDMVRVERDDEPATWVKLTGNDHFLHSLTLMRASLRIKALVSSEVENPRTNVGFIACGPSHHAPLLSSSGIMNHG